jgi:hypothetical protein
MISSQGFQVGVAFPIFLGEQAGVGQPFAKIFDFRFGISDLKKG